jgi:hypothetical protein
MGRKRQLLSAIPAGIAIGLGLSYSRPMGTLVKFLGLFAIYMGVMFLLYVCFQQRKRSKERPMMSWMNCAHLAA